MEAKFFKHHSKTCIYDYIVIWWINRHINSKIHMAIQNVNHSSRTLKIHFTIPSKMKKKISTPQYEVRVFDIDTPLKDAIPVLQEVLEKFGVYLVDVITELNLPPSDDIILCFSDEPLSHTQLRNLYLIDNL